MTTQKIAVTTETTVSKQNGGSIYFRTIVAMSGLLILTIFAGLSSSGGSTATRNVQASSAAPVRSRLAASDRLKNAKRFDSVAAAVESVRYDAESNDTGVTAYNDANGLQMNFSANGLRLSSGAKENRWTSDWRLASVGYGNNQKAVESGVLTATGKRIELNRAKQNLSEWYENSRKGVEHGFTLASRPENAVSGENLRLVINLSGDLTAVADSDGQALTLLKDGGETALRYQNLKVWDVEGKPLTAQMRSNGREVFYDVDDTSATYPITIDPTFAQAQKLASSPGVAEDQFGAAVAISGNLAIIGASANGTAVKRSGAAYIYVRTGASWALEQKLTPDDAEAGDSFGWSVALDGSTAVIGAFGDTVGANTTQGSAYVFFRSGTTWTQQAKLTASDGGKGDLFGWSVAISFDTIVVGANSDTVGANVAQGSAYVYRRIGQNWTEQQKITAADGSAGDYFGESVAIDGDTIIVGANEDKIGSNTAQGSAYVFIFTLPAWSQQQKLTAADGAIFDNFGFSVALSGNTVIVGTLQNLGVNSQQGSAYVFVRNAGTWTQQQKLTAADGATDDSFGGSVAVLGDRALIGAFGDSNGAIVHQGSAYLYNRTGSTWTLQQKFLAADGAAEDGLGSSVGLSSDTFIVGAMADSIGANLFQGSAYIFAVSAGITGKVTTPSGQPVKSAVVSITDPAGVRRTALTNNFGTYTFDSVIVGQSYLITVSSKRYRFAAQNLPVNGDLANIDFVGTE